MYLLWYTTNDIIILDVLQRIIMINERIENKMHDSLTKYKLVGFVDFSIEEQELLYSEAGLIIRRANSFRDLSMKEKDLIFIATVNALKDWRVNDEDDERYAECINRKIIGKDGDATSEILKYIDKTIEEVCKRYGLPIINEARRYYNTILAHALSTKTAWHSLFDLCWEIFCKDLGLNYLPKDQCFDDIVWSLVQHFNSIERDGDYLKLGSKVYSLNAAIKRLACEYPDIVVYLIDFICSFFDKVYNKSQIVENDTYFIRLLNEWWLNKKVEFVTCKDKPTRHFIAKDYEHISVRYELLNGHVNIVILPFLLKKNIYSYPILNVYVNESIVVKDRFITDGSGLGMAAIGKTVDLDNFLHNGDNIHIRVEISHDGDIIYDSKRQFI